MTWSMPQKTLKIVAAVLVVLSVGAFGLGLANAPRKGRLPGERVTAGATADAAIDAAEAMPLSQDRIEGAPAPRELTAEEKAKIEADRAAKAEAEAAAKLAQAEGAAPKPATPGAAPDRVGDLIDSVTPPPNPDDPPH